MLMERGLFLLDDPIEKYLPEFKNMRVLSGKRDNAGNAKARKSKTSITIRHLLTHTSGIGYSFTHPKLGEFYRAADIRDWAYQDGTTIEEVVGRLAGQPLAFDPGTNWLYGLNIDVLGRLVEVLSAATFAEFLAQGPSAVIGKIPSGRSGRAGVFAGLQNARPRTSRSNGANRRTPRPRTLG